MDARETKLRERAVREETRMLVSSSEHEVTVRWGEIFQHEEFLNTLF